MKKIILMALVMSVTWTAQAQRIAENSYWFYFTDKQNNGYSTNQPQEFLSQRSIDRRGWQYLPVDQSDLPVTKSYVDSLAALGLEVMYTSKWLNGALVSSLDKELIDTLHRLSFIDTLRWEHSADDRFFPGMPQDERFDPPLPSPPAYRYGFSGDQIRQVKVDFLHEKGYTGEGVLLAVLDAGFINLTTLPAFETPLANGQIHAARNFVEKYRDVYNANSHGTSVSSIIIANWPDTLMGTAPGVQLLLATTEDVRSETRIEEYAWIEGAEWADSLGTDIINTSLGYTTFDDSTTNYSYRDMNGKTAHISIANGMTAAKGMISVTSAGNSGNDDWYYIGAPADAANILAVGAVNKDGVLTGFSSRGPTYDHRIKPEVSAMGALTAVQSTDSTAKLGYGTSYSSPVIAGATAALWQAYPALTANELMQWIIESGNRAGLPDVEYGYGIPSFRKAFYAITAVDQSLLPESLKVYPNPFTDYIFIGIPAENQGTYTINLYNMQGRLVASERGYAPGRTDLPLTLLPGMYIIEIKNKTDIYRSRIIKK
jgi:serine protease AprX